MNPQESSDERCRSFFDTTSGRGVWVTPKSNRLFSRSLTQQSAGSGLVDPNTQRRDTAPTECEASFTQLRSGNVQLAPDNPQGTSSKAAFRTDRTRRTTAISRRSLDQPHLGRDSREGAGDTSPVCSDDAASLAATMQMRAGTVQQRTSTIEQTAANSRRPDCNSLRTANARVPLSCNWLRTVDARVLSTMTSAWRTHVSRFVLDKPRFQPGKPLPTDGNRLQGTFNRL